MIRHPACATLNGQIRIYGNACSARCQYALIPTFVCQFLSERLYSNYGQMTSLKRLIFRLRRPVAIQYSHYMERYQMQPPTVMVTRRTRCFILTDSFIV